MKHIIEIHQDGDTERSYWECDCGAAGSTPTDHSGWGWVDLAAEKHVKEGETRVFRYPAR